MNIKDDENTKLHFNGIDASTGDYLFPAMRTAELAEVATGKTIEEKQEQPEHLAELEVRTYVSSNPGAAAAAERETLARDGDLRAFTRIAFDGDIDVIVPERDGGIDTELWHLHLEFVKQAQTTRAEILHTLISAATGFIKR